MKTIYISFTPSMSYCARVSLLPRLYLNMLFMFCHAISSRGLSLNRMDLMWARMILFIDLANKHFLTPYSRHCAKSVTSIISINSSNTTKELLFLPLWRWQKWGIERLRTLSKTIYEIYSNARQNLSDSKCDKIRGGVGGAVFWATCLA